MTKINSKLLDAVNAQELLSVIKRKQITNLNLTAGDDYELNLPEHTLFVEPLFKTSGSDFSGGQFLTPGAAYTYFTNNATQSNYKGVYIVCSNTGKINISTYQHNGTIVTGFRIWYLEI